MVVDDTISATPLARRIAMAKGLSLPGIATIMAATASFDHRAIDGAVAARFMDAFRHFVENPMAMVP